MGTDSAGLIIRLASSFSFGIEIFSKSSTDKLSRKFTEAGIASLPAQQYLSGSLVLSVFLSFLLLIILSPSHSLLLASGASLGLFSLSFLSFYFLPSLVAQRRKSIIESELPFVLREFSVYLDLGIPFERCLEKISTRQYELSSEFSRASSEIKSGSSVQTALSSLSLRFPSITLKRSLLLLSSVYETGASSEPLRRTAEELAATQFSSLRSLGSRLSLLSILFIATSALMPAFFAVYLAVSPLLSGEQPSTAEAFAAYLLLFPLANLFSLSLMAALLPPSGKTATAKLTEEYLRSIGIPYGKRPVLAILAAISILLSAISLSLGSVPLAILSLSIGPLLYFLATYAASRRTNEAETYLPDALYGAASLHRLMSAEKLLLSLSKGGYGRLSEAFEIAYRRLKAGDSFQKSLAAASRHCPSPLVERALSLLVVCYEAGGNMHFALREAASDIASFFMLVRERAAQLSIQRYTVLAASALLVPAIIGTVISIVPSISSASSTAFQGQQPVPIIPSLLLAVQLYLLINAALSSAILAFTESNKAMLALYLVLIIPLSQLVFMLASSSVKPA